MPLLKLLYMVIVDDHDQNSQFLVVSYLMTTLYCLLSKQKIKEVTTETLMACLGWNQKMPNRIYRCPNKSTMLLNIN